MVWCHGCTGLVTIFVCNAYVLMLDAYSSQPEMIRGSDYPQDCNILFGGEEAQLLHTVQQAGTSPGF